MTSLLLNDRKWISSTWEREAYSAIELSEDRPHGKPILASYKVLRVGCQIELVDTESRSKARLK